jgi:hypothetical protein
MGGYFFFVDIIGRLVDIVDVVIHEFITIFEENFFQEFFILENKI